MGQPKKNRTLEWHQREARKAFDSYKYHVGQVSQLRFVTDVGDGKLDEIAAETEAARGYFIHTPCKHWTKTHAKETILELCDFCLKLLLDSPKLSASKKNGLKARNITKNVTKSNAQTLQEVRSGISA